MKLPFSRKRILGAVAVLYCLGMVVVLLVLTTTALRPREAWDEETEETVSLIEDPIWYNYQRGDIRDAKGRVLATTQQVAASAVTQQAAPETTPDATPDAAAPADTPADTPAEAPAEQAEEQKLVDQRVYTYPNSVGVLLGYYRYDSQDDKYRGLEERFNTVLTVGDQHEDNRQANRGNDIYLTLDISLQEKIVALLEDTDYPEITVIVQEVNTGAIKICAVWPGYNTNDYMSDAAYRSQVNSGELGRNLLSYPAYLYPRPLGSTLKLLSSVAIINEGKEKEKLENLWERQIGGGTVTTTQADGQLIDLPQALEVSSNTYFAYKIAAEVGKKAYLEVAEAFSLGGENRKLSCDFADLESTWLAETPFDLAQAAYGQGRTELTPIQLNAITGAIACGRFYRPYLVAYQTRPDPAGGEGEQVHVTKPDLLSQPVSKRARQLIREGMLAVADNNDLNTGGDVNYRGYLLAVKTGTAETGSAPNNATLTGYFPADQGQEPLYAMTICAPESGCSGASLAPLYGQIADLVYGYLVYNQ